jgi:peroxiredoxin
MKYKVGDKITRRNVVSAMGTNIDIPDAVTEYTHLQFRRWEGCPICNVHMANLRRNADRIKLAGVREVIYFHSTKEAIKKFQNDIPFDFIADSKKVVYREFGVESSYLALLHPKTLWAALKGMLSLRFNLKMRNGPHGLPAEFLIGSDGTVVAAKYGKHSADQWSVNELLETADKARSANTSLATKQNDNLVQSNVA